MLDQFPTGLARLRRLAARSASDTAKADRRISSRLELPIKGHSFAKARIPAVERAMLEEKGEGYFCGIAAIGKIFA